MSSRRHAPFHMLRPPSAADQARPEAPRLSPPIPEALLHRQVHVVMGKGGVGRSAVSLALALGLWRLGRHVLLAQVHAPDAHGPLLGMPVREDISYARDGLAVVDVDPRASLREYVMMVVKFRRVYEAIFENRFVTYFLRFIPSLAEINMLGKLWFHAQEVQGGKPRFDHVIIDAPATGHGLTFLKVARVVSRTAPPGPLYTQTAEMAALFADPHRTAVHVVTTPDELSVQEAEELIAHVRTEAFAPLGVAILNRVPEMILSSLDLEPLRAFEQEPALRPLAVAAKRRRLWETGAQHAANRLNATGLPLVRLAEAPTEEFTLVEAERMGQALVQPPAEGAP